MAYTKVQFISYQVDTFPGIDPTTKQECYLGTMKSKTDIQYRCNLMRNAINEAGSKTSNNSSTLKVFMAPEFYFRGKDGAYPIEEISTIMETMRKHTNRIQFRDWIFVFGTALGYLDHGDSSKEVYNVAMVQKGGANAVDVHSSVVVYKEYISHIDFIRTQGVQTCPHCGNILVCDNCGEQIDQDWDASSNRVGKIGTKEHNLRPTSGSRDLLSLRVERVGKGREMTKTGLGGQSIFTMGGVTFGLEICLDHLNGRLRDSPPAKGDPLIQVHLIPSAGARIKETSVACMKGGLIFNVDGHSRTQVNRNRGDEKNPKLLYKGYPNAIAVAHTIDLNLGTIAKGWRGFFNEEGYVHIYEEQGVPAARVAA